MHQRWIVNELRLNIRPLRPTVRHAVAGRLVLATEVVD
jgi:hypothetical protein